MMALERLSDALAKVIVRRPWGVVLLGLSVVLTLTGISANMVN